MTDSLSAIERSENMRRIRSRDTAPELRVRGIVHRLGYRFQLHGKSLPGRPDIILSRHRKIIFVHGCFFHQHGRCVDGRRIPKSRKSYWIPKLAGNKARDRLNRSRLARLGWRSLTVWECDLKLENRLQNKIAHFIEGGIGRDNASQFVSRKRRSSPSPNANVAQSMLRVRRRLVEH